MSDTFYIARFYKEKLLSRSTYRNHFFKKEHNKNMRELKSKENEQDVASIEAIHYTHFEVRQKYRVFTRLILSASEASDLRGLVSAGAFIIHAAPLAGRAQP